jgi:hypothetical protein
MRGAVVRCCGERRDESGNGEKRARNEREVKEREKGEKKETTTKS